MSLRQALGLEPARYSFQLTRHEPLAQGAGRNTFWMDDRHTLWRVMGEKETGAPADTASSGDSPCNSGIRIATPLTLKLNGIMGDRFAPGRYRVEVQLKDDPDDAFVEMRGSPAAHPVLGPAAVIDVTSGIVEITIRPQHGPVVACSAVIVPESNHP
jgi:hypothetical protein